MSRDPRIYTKVKRKISVSPNKNLYPDALSIQPCLNPSVEQQTGNQNDPVFSSSGVPWKRIKTETDVIRGGYEHSTTLLPASPCDVEDLSGRGDILRNISNQTRHLTESQNSKSVVNGSNELRTMKPEPDNSSPYGITSDVFQPADSPIPLIRSETLPITNGRSTSCMDFDIPKLKTEQYFDFSRGTTPGIFEAAYSQTTSKASETYHLHCPAFDLPENVARIDTDIYELDQRFEESNYPDFTEASRGPVLNCDANVEVVVLPSVQKIYEIIDLTDDVDQSDVSTAANSPADNSPGEQRSVENVLSCVVKKLQTLKSRNNESSNDLANIFTQNCASISLQKFPTPLLEYLHFNTKLDVLVLYRLKSFLDGIKHNPHCN